jgi:photosystem II stability/assembly factor-like uncharacterized protein
VAGTGRKLVGFSAKAVTPNSFVPNGWIVAGCAQLTDVKFPVDAFIVASREDNKWRFSDVDMVTPRDTAFVPCGMRGQKSETALFLSLAGMVVPGFDRAEQKRRLSLASSATGPEVSAWQVIKRLAAKPHTAFTIDRDPKLRPENEVVRRPVLNAVFFGTDSIGCAVGDVGTLVCTNDGGSTWTDKKIDQAFNLQGGFFRDGLRGWAVGNAKGAGLILRTRDGGRSWQQERLNDYELSGLHSVWFADERRGWAVGEVQKNGPPEGIILATEDGGINWAPQYLARSRSSALHSIKFIDAKQGWAVGHNLIMRTTDGGRHWDEQYYLQGEYFFDLDLSSPTELWVTGSNGSLLKTNDDGATWKVVHLPSSYRNLWAGSVRFVASRRGWVAGNDGAILSTANGGRSWQLESIGRSSFLRSLASTSHSLYAVGNGGTILRRRL